METTMKMKAAAGLCLVLLIGFSTAARSAQMETPFTVVNRYNAAGQLTGTIQPGAGSGYMATRYTYGSDGATRGLLLQVEAGNLTTWSNEYVAPAAWTGFMVDVTTSYSYDTFGRKATERVIGRNGQSESLVQYSYDDWGRVQCKAVRMNPGLFGALPASACTLGTEGSFGPDRIFRYTYDALDQVLTEERAVGTALQQVYVTNTYVGRGKLDSQTDANGNRTELRYDANWRMNRRVYPSPNGPGAVNEGDYHAYAYDNNGNVTWERKRNGQTITHTIDANNRLTFKDLSDNTYSQDVSYDYDLRGLTLSSCFGSDAGPGITNTFDGFGRLTAATTNMGGTSRTLNYRYDLNGNRTRVTHPDNWFFEYHFDGVNRMDSLSESTAASASAGVTSVLTIDYQSGGGRWHIYRPSGATTTYTQDNIRRLESFTQDFAGTSNDLINSFQYNPASQITFLARSNSLYAITGQVSRTGTYTPNGLNQYTSIANQSITYDDNGNLTSDGSVNYVYDMENHLVATTGSVATSMVYDPLGRLFQVSVPGKTIQFLYDGDAIVAEYNASTGALISRFAHGDQVDEPLLQYSGASLGASARSYLHADHQGSIIAQSSSSGAIKARLAYDPYGIAASGNALRFGYTGQMYLSTLGLNYYKARWYSPKLGRFLQTDPIFYADDMNMYAYGRNDPILNKDPTGTKCEGDEKTGSCTADLFNGIDIAKARKEGMISAGIEKKISRYEKNLSHGYRQAVRFGENKVSVRGWASAPPREVSGNQIADKLRDAKFNVETRADGYQLYGTAGAYSAAYLPQSDGTQLYDSSAWSVTIKTLGLPAGSLATNRYQAGNGLHEMIHKFPGLGSSNPFHQESFREAVDEILDYR